MKKTFNDKTRLAVLSSSHGFCQCSRDCTEKAVEFHHRFSNTKVNQKKYPLFLQSPMNCLPISRDCHINARHLPESLVQVYEEYLMNLMGGGK